MAPATSKVLLAAAASCAVVDAAQLVAGNKRGCGHMSMKVRKHSKKVQLRNPGAGLSEFTPFEESFNDGFMMIGCVKDEMHINGDKFGDGKFSYKMGDVANVTIVHYTEVIASEDAEPMTHEVCFNFCRSVPQMNFFGITNGRDCYCTPYYHQVAGDSSDCDAVCDGDNGMMCGGKTKSSIFEMHACNDAEGNLADASSAAIKQQGSLTEKAGVVTEAATKMQDVAAALQDIFGKVGDSAATAHLQEAKVWAGKLTHAAADSAALAEKVTETEVEATGTSGGPAPAMEKATDALIGITGEAAASEKALAKMEAQGIAPEGGKSGDLYYPVMYFVDKEFKEVPSTCGGPLAGEPLVGDFEGCAEACEKTAGKCVGFNYLASSEGGLCFMMSELDTATYYTGCESEKPAFLQKKAREGTEAKCVVKFSDFEGTTLKPNPSGKCKQCLKEANKADRCFA
eukprot:TRINITY_DN2410_c0_g1_i1.p1 TRINITY_DN2410_c0_g1~~TRINITY_DN2410_c0_g1_i1.p1  ORF type:complete len:456 (-),score=173.18 TRINITY_DN2410_c0_g1_i1:121-1488(-)